MIYALDVPLYLFIYFSLTVEGIVITSSEYVPIVVNTQG